MLHAPEAARPTGDVVAAPRAAPHLALPEAGIEPDWVIGTSIGAINAGLIAGNEPKHRLERLREFWSRVTHGPLSQLLGAAPFAGGLASRALTFATGVQGFFELNPWALFGP